VVFVPPTATPTPVEPAGPDGPAASTARRGRSKDGTPAAEPDTEQATDLPIDAAAGTGPADGLEDEQDGEHRRRRRGRRGRGRARSGAADGEGGADADDPDATTEPAAAQPAVPQQATAADDEGDEAGTGGTRRRRRRRRRSAGGSDDASTDDPADTVVHVREPRAAASDEVQSVKGSTRLEAKRQRRREGRETQRRRPPILSEAEFLARREAVERTMVVRQKGDRTQIAVLEDGVLVEHYVTKSGSTSYAGNVYLGKVQNVLPSMEAAFIDIGKGRNAVLYAGEVNWDVAGLEGKARSIEQALRSGDAVLVQVTKDPIGHKGARLTSQISLPGRYLVYVPGGSMTGISRKLPDTERQRLKDILKRIVPDDAGVIIRTAAEGTSEEELASDVSRLQAQWQVIRDKAAKGGAPVLLSEEPDLAIRVVRDVFNEDFDTLVVSGGEAWDTLQQYISHVAPDLAPRLSRHTAETDVFADLRIDEQLMKALDRKVWLPSGGSLVIDRTEAMTVVDVNTGKFTGKGGNLEETVTRNNLEAAEEIVRQLRLRDVGGIIVIDFIDMVLENNRDLVLRRLMECLGRDRTKHQVAEVTSLGLVQMTRKRVGQGLLEAFSEPCEVCKGRGIIVHTEPVDDSRRRSGGGAGQGGRRSESRKAEPVAAEPSDLEPSDLEPSDLEPSGIDLSDIDLSDIEPVDLESDDLEPVDLESDDLEPVDLEPGVAEPEPAEPGRVRDRRRSARSEPPGGENVLDGQGELAGPGLGDTVGEPDGAPGQPAGTTAALLAETGSAGAEVAGAGMAGAGEPGVAGTDQDADQPTTRRRHRRASTRPAGPPVPAGAS
jgi:ribonuclease E